MGFRLKCNAKIAAIMILTAGFLQADNPTGAGAFIRKPEGNWQRYVRPRLLGKVKSVRTERAGFSLRYWQWVEGTRVPLHLLGFNAAGNIVRHTFYNQTKDGKPDDVREYRYDDSKREASFHSNSPTDGNSLVRVFVERYNEKGDKVEHEEFDPRGKAERVTRFERTYDDAGRVTRILITSNGTLRSRGEFSYRDGHTTEVSTRYYEDGSAHVETKTDYDENGSTSTETVHMKDGSLAPTRVLTFDKNGNLKRSAEYIPDGKIMGEGKYDYEFDPHGNPVKQTAYGCGPRLMIRLRIIHWDFGWGCHPREVVYTTYEYYPDTH